MYCPHTWRSASVSGSNSSNKTASHSRDANARATRSCALSLGAERGANLKSRRGSIAGVVAMPGSANADSHERESSDAGRARLLDACAGVDDDAGTLACPVRGEYESAAIPDKSAPPLLN